MLVEHPSGECWHGSYTGQDVIPALHEMLNRVENEWRSDKGRNDRPRTTMQRDHTRRVDEHAVAAIRGIPGRDK